MADKIIIKHRFSGATLYEFQPTDAQQASGLAMQAALEATTTSRAYLRDANLGGANLDGANLDGANLGGANLRGAYLRDANLGGANLDGANLGGASLGGANLRGAYLRGANLRGAYLGGANLGDANLRDANLRGANLEGANLRGAYLRGANLRGAYLRGANLRGANLGGANLDDDIKLAGDRPLLQIGPIGSRGDYLQAYITTAGLRISTGCFRLGTRDTFEAAIDETHGDNAHGHEYRAALALIDAHAAEWMSAAEPAAASKPEQEAQS